MGSSQTNSTFQHPHPLSRRIPFHLHSIPLPLCPLPLATDHHLTKTTSNHHKLPHHLTKTTFNHHNLPHHLTISTSKQPIMSSTPLPSSPAKKKGFSTAAMVLRSLGCSASSTKVHSPLRRRRKKRIAKEEKVEEGDRLPPRPAIELAMESGEFLGENSQPNWCLGERRGGGGSRRSSLLESRVETTVFGSEIGSPRHLRRSWRVYGSPGLLEELMMFDAGLFLGEMDVLDRFQDLRLDVDSMTYEELLELEDSIGYVNTGLREDEIIRCVRKTKHSIFNSLLQLSAETNRKCSICLDDYGVGDEVGKLVCGHGYHTSCIKQWLLRKNTCPVCKAAVGRS